MPLPELLALYGYGRDNQKSPTDDDAPSEPMDEQESESDPQDRPSQLHALYEPIPDSDHDASRLLRCK